MAQIRIDQATQGTPGVSRHDLVGGTVITLVATLPAAGSGVSYLWEIIDKVGSTATLTSTTDQTTTIGPLGSISAPCGFKIRLTANDNGTVTTTERIASVRSTNAGLRFVLFGEAAPLSQTLDSNNNTLSTDNALYADLAGLGSSGYNWRSHAEWAKEVVEAIEAIATGGGGGGAPSGAAGGDLTSTYPNPTVARIRNTAIETPLSPTDGQVLAWDNAGGEWVATTLSTAPSGTASGDLDGSYPNPIVSGLRTYPISVSLAPVDGQVLTYDEGGGEWNAATPSTTATPTGAAGGDLSGTYPNPTVDAVQGQAFASPLTVTAGDVLVWDGTAFDALALTGDIGGTLPATVVEAIQGRAVLDAAPDDQDTLVWNTANSRWEPGPASTAGLFHFNINGQLTKYVVPTDFVDGLREVVAAGAVTQILVSQEVDGDSGTTEVQVFKVDTAGTETQISASSSLQIANGSDKARLSSTSFVSAGAATLLATDRLGVKLITAQGGTPADVTVTVVVGEQTYTTPGLPEDDEITQALLASVTGTTFLNVGHVYLSAGTILSASSRVYMGCDNGTDDAELEIRHADTAVLLDTIVKTGLPGDQAPTSDIVVATAGWYSLRLRSDTALTVATLFGLKFVYSLGNGTRIRQATDETVTGNTFTNVGSVYLPAGLLQGASSLFMGCTTADPDGTEVEIRRETGATLLVSVSNTGPLAAVGIPPTAVPASDWYHIRLRGNGAGIVAQLKGIDITVLT